MYVLDWFNVGFIAGIEPTIAKIVIVPPTGIESKGTPVSGLNPSCGMVLICTLSGTNDSSAGNISIKQVCLQ